jgi:hypothetical protein
MTFGHPYANFVSGVTSARGTYFLWQFLMRHAVWDTRARRGGGGIEAQMVGKIGGIQRESYITWVVDPDTY